MFVCVFCRAPTGCDAAHHGLRPGPAPEEVLQEQASRLACLLRLAWLSFLLLPCDCPVTVLPAACADAGTGPGISAAAAAAAAAVFAVSSATAGGVARGAAVFFFMVLLVMGVVLLLLLMAAVAVLVLRWVGSRARRGSLVSPRVRALFLPCLRPANDPVSTAARAAFWPPWNRPPRKPLGWRVGWRGFAAPAAAGAAGAAGAAAASPSPAAASPSAAAAAAGAAASISRGGGDHGGDVLWRGSTLVARSSDFR